MFDTIDMFSLSFQLFRETQTKYQHFVIPKLTEKAFT